MNIIPVSPDKELEPSEGREILLLCLSFIMQCLLQTCILGMANPELSEIVSGGTLFPHAVHLAFCFYWFKTVCWLFMVWLSNHFTGAVDQALH